MPPVWNGELPPRTVKPRKRAPAPPKPILAALTRDRTFLWEGEIRPWAELPAVLRKIAGADIVTDDSLNLQAFLDGELDDGRFWQRQIEDRTRAHYVPGAERMPETDYCVVAMFGWRRQDENGTRRKGGAKTFRVLDVGVFLRAQGLNVLEPYGGLELAGLHRFAADVQDFCYRAGFPLGLSVGAIGASMHYDARFFPKPRRKLPKWINDLARPTLGNHYQLACKPGSLHPKVTSVDLAGAHHRAAIQAQMPDPDTTRGWGYHARADLPEDGELAHDWIDRAHYAVAGTDLFDRLLAEQHGLFLVVLRAGKAISDDPLAHPAVRTAGVTYRYLYAQELEYVRTLPGVRIAAIVAGWSSPYTVDGVAVQSFFAREQIANATPARKTWLKPAMLACYGAYAALPRERRTGWLRASKGRETAYVGPQGDILPVLEHKQPAREHGAANVLWLGIIHAITRCETLAYARELRAAGHDVLCLYVDGIYLRQKQAPIPARPGWRAKDELEDCLFVDEQHWIAAGGKHRLPGIAPGSPYFESIREDYYRAVRDAHRYGQIMSVTDTVAVGYWGS